MSQPTLKGLNNTQYYLNQFKKLDKANLGYLNVAQVKDYFKSQQLPQDGLIELASHTNQDRLTPEQFASAINLSQIKNNGDVGNHSSKFSSLLRHCEEAMKLFEKDRRMKVQSNDSKDKLLKAFKALEDFMKQFIKSLDDTSSNNDFGLNRSTAPSTFEKMPGTYDFDTASSDMASRERSMPSPTAAPVFLKKPSLVDITASPNSRQNEKEPALDSPSPLPQMNDAAFMSGLKPISSRNLNGDDVKPNNAHENDTYRSNVLDSLRNAAMDNTEFDDNDSKGKEILHEDESHERDAPATFTKGITSNINNAMEDVGINNFKPDAITPRSLNKQSSDTDSKFEPQPATSGPSDAIVPLAATVATVATVTAATAVALSDVDKSESYPASPFETATDKTHAPETFQGGLGYNSIEPFTKNAKDTELKLEFQPSSAKWNKLNDADALSSSSLKSNESNQSENKSKPFERETFQGGPGGNSTKPYIKNEKDTLLKPEDQPSFGAEQERLSKLKSAEDEKVESTGMEQPNVSKTSTSKDTSYAPEFFQGGLGGNETKPYIKNEKDTLLRPEDQPSFGAEQEKLRKLNELDIENEYVVTLKDTDQDVEPSSSLGSTLSKISAGAAGIAGAAALGLSERNDGEKGKDKSIDFALSNDASDHGLTPPGNVYSPSLTSGNSLKNANHTDVISNEALSYIADKVDADIKHNDLKGNSATTDKDGVISSDALDKIADNLDAALEENIVPTSISLDASYQKDTNVLVDRDISLPPNIDNEVDIETSNNDSSRSPLVGKTAISSTVFGTNDSANGSPGMNSAYTDGSSDIPDSAYRAAPAMDNDESDAESHSPAAPVVNTPNVSSTSRSLNPNNAIKDDSSKDSSKDDANSKEDKPGFFKRLFGGRSKSPESTSRSVSPTSDKAISKDSASPPDNKGSSKFADAPMVTKFDAFNEGAPQVALNTTGNLIGSNNALDDISPDVHGADASLKTPEINANMPSATFNSNIETPNVDLSNVDNRLDKSFDNDIKSPGFNANANVNDSGLSNPLEKLSTDIKGLKENVFGKIDGSVDSPNADGELPSLDTKLNCPNVDLPDVDGNLDSSIKMPTISGELLTLDADTKTPSLDKPSLSGNLSGSLDNLDVDTNLPSLDTDVKNPNFDNSTPEDKFGTPAIGTSLSADFKGPDSVLPKLSGKLDKSISTPEIDGDMKSSEFRADTDLGASGLSDSLDKLSMGPKDLKSDISGKFDSSVDSLNADDNLPSASLPNVDGKLSGSLEAPEINAKLPSIDSNLRSPRFNADISTDHPDLSASPGKHSSEFKDFKNNLDGKFNGLIDTPDIDGKLPSLNADLERPNVVLHDIDGNLPSPNTDMKTTKLDMPSLGSSFNTPDVGGKLPSLDTDVQAPDLDLPNVRGKLDRSISAPGIRSDIKTSGFNSNVNMDSSSLSGSLGKLSVGHKDLKDDISGKFQGSIDTPDIDGKFSSVDLDLKSPKLGQPSIEGELTSSMDTPFVDDKFPSLDAGLKSPDIDLPNVSGKLDRSISAPDVNGNMKSPDFDVDMKTNSPDLSGSLGKLSAGLRDLKNDISSKIDGSVESPKVEGNLSTLGANLKGPSTNLPIAGGKIDGSIETPNIDDPSLSANIKIPDVDMPNADGKLGGSVNTSDIDGEFPSVDSDLKSPVSDVNVNVDRPGLFGSFGKLSSSFNGLKDSISGRFSVDTPSVDGKLPSLAADLEESNVDLPGIDSKVPSLGTDLKAPKLSKPSLDIDLDSIVNVPSIGGNLPSVDIDTKNPNIDLPNVSGKLDRSVSAPDVNVDLKFPGADATIDRPDLSSSFGKLSSSFKGLKDDISGKFDGSIQSPNADGELPTVDVNLKGPSLDLLDADSKLDGSIQKPDFEGKIPSLQTDSKGPNVDVSHGKYDGSLNADLQSPEVNLPNVSGTLNRPIKTPETDVKLSSIDGDLKSPKVDADANVDTEYPSLSGALDKLSSSFKGLKDNITGVFSGSTDTPIVDGELPSANTDYNGPKFGLPDTDLGLDSSVGTPKISSDIPPVDGELNTPGFNLPGGNINLNASFNTPGMDTKLPHLDKNLHQGAICNLPSVSGSRGLDGSMTASKADVYVPDMRSPNLDASADGNVSTAPIAPLHKIGLLGSFGKVNAGLTTPKADADIPQVAPNNDSPVASPRSPRLSLNKVSSNTDPDGSVKYSNMDVDAPETSSGFKSPSFYVHVNSKPALEGDLSSGLHRSVNANASGSGDISADKKIDEGSSSFFSKPIEKISGVINNFMGDGGDEISEDDKTHDKMTSTGYATLKTRPRNESPDDLSTMLDDIVKRRFSNTPSESDVNSVVSDTKANKKKSASHKSRNLDASANLNADVSEPHASFDGDRSRSMASDSRFKELDEQEGDATEYSTPLTSPVILNAAPSSSITVSSVTSDKIDGLESDVEKQLDAKSVSVGETPQVPAHEEDQLSSPSKTHRSSISLQSTSFQDHSAADAIKGVYDNMTSKLMTGGSKSGNGTDDRVLKVRDGFENFNGFGIKCVSDNEDEEKRSAPLSTLK